MLVAAIAVHLYVSRRKQQSQLVTLEDPKEKYMLPLVEKEEISHDTRRFRFGLPTADHVLGLPVGQHIHLIADVDGEIIVRAYTPVSSDDNHGFVDLLIKVYKKNVHPKFPHGGKMSQYVDSLKLGDQIAFRGPTGKLKYLGNGRFSIKKLQKDPPQQVNAAKVNLIAGGTGITPMLQLIRDVLSRPEEKHIQLALLFANQSENDILLRNELDQLAGEHPEQLKVWYTVDQASDSWKFSTGFVKSDMIKEHLHAPGADTITLMCGPPPMINYACVPNLEALGYSVEQRFAY